MFLRLRNQRRVIAIAHRSAGICGDLRSACAAGDQVCPGMVAGIGKIQGIKVLPIHQHLQVKVRAGGITGAAHFGNDIPLFTSCPADTSSSEQWAYFVVRVLPSSMVPSSTTISP